jgi:hypothetical protein
LTKSGGACKIVQLYSGESISADNWMFNSDGAYGIIGLGPNSPLWNGLADVSTLKVTYSIELARVSSLTNEHGLKQTSTV